MDTSLPAEIRARRRFGDGTNSQALAVLPLFPAVL
jgi:hypothetical protein